MRHGAGVPRLRFYPLNFYARCGEVVHRAFTTSLVAALPRWEQARNKLPTSYLCATGYASVPMLGRALAEPVAPGKPEKLNREVISDLFLKSFSLKDHQDYSGHASFV